jgi:hypothetical protein
VAGTRLGSNQRNSRGGFDLIKCCPSTHRKRLGLDEKIVRQIDCSFHLWVTIWFYGCVSILGFMVSFLPNTNPTL